MPLSRGGSNKTISSKPKSKKKAQKQTVVVASEKATGGSVRYVKRRDADQLTKIC